MLDDRRKMRDGDMPLLDRIDVALRRVTSGEGQMRVPAEATDPDVVLFDCKKRIAELETEIERLRSELTAAHVVWEREADHYRGEIERLRGALHRSANVAIGDDYNR